MSLPVYSAYKDSGVEWLREVPKLWQVMSVAMKFTLRNGYPFDSELFSSEGIPTDRLIRIRDILGNDAPVFTVENCPESCVINNGDVLIGMDGDFNKVHWIEGKAKLNQRVCAVRGPDFIWDRFFFYGIGSPLKIINDLTFATTVKHLASSQILKLRFPIPSYGEVLAIIKFLDSETARIDTLIAEQQRLIDLLKEKRQAVISHAVTKGLDPTVPMKDSGVEWLGDVPAHWVICRAKLVSDIFVPQRNKPELNDSDGTAWVTMEDMNDGYILETKNKVSEQANADAGSKILLKGAVIASCIGRFGIVAINSVDVIINQQLQAFIPKRIKGEYLKNLVLLSREYFELIGTAATLVYVNQQGFENLPVLVPTLSEQDGICTYVDNANKRFDELLSSSFESINLLGERRSALIAAAVTGKIDVRDWRPPAESTRPQTQSEAMHG